jgi:hypothetical protein
MPTLHFIAMPMIEVYGWAILIKPEKSDSPPLERFRAHSPNS